MNKEDKKMLLIMLGMGIMAMTFPDWGKSVLGGIFILVGIFG